LRRLIALVSTLVLLTGVQFAGSPAAQAADMGIWGSKLSWEPSQWVMPEPYGYVDLSFSQEAQDTSGLVGLSTSLSGPQSGLIQFHSTRKDQLRATTFNFSVRGSSLIDGFGPYTLSFRVAKYPEGTETLTRDVYFTPRPPQDARAEAVSGSPFSAQLSWTPPSMPSSASVAGYSVTWPTGEIKTTSSSVRVDDLPGGSAIPFSVRTIGGPNESAPVTVSFTTPLNPVPRPPLPPDNPVDVTFSTVAAKSMRMTWQPPAISNPPVTGYQVSVKGGSTLTTSDTSIRITNLTPSTEYEFTVRAINALGSSPGVKVIAMTDKDISEPRNLQNVPIQSSTSTRLTWLAPLDNGGAPIKEYLIDWMDSGKKQLLEVEETNATISSLKPGTRYTFSVRAINQDGDISAPASITMVTPLNPQDRPARPNRPDVVRVVDSTMSVIAIDWEAPPPSNPPVTGYVVSVKGGKTIEVQATTALVRNLQPNTTYEISVQSVSTGGASDPVVMWAKTAATPGPAPSPGPAPQPFSPAAPTEPTLSTNVDGSRDADGNPATVRQTAPGNWPVKTVARNDVPLPIEKRSGFETNAGQLAELLVSSKSPSVKKVTIKLNPKTKTYNMTAILKPKKKSGSVVLMVAAPGTTVGETRYEPLVAVQKFTIRK